MSWWRRQLGWYVTVCLAGWAVGSIVLLEPAYVFGFVLFYGPVFGIPTALVLLVLYRLGKHFRPEPFRLTATVVLPLIAVLLPVDTPPGAGYGTQLLVQVPIQVAFAWMVRPPSPSPSRRLPWTFYTLPTTVMVWLVLLTTLGHGLLSDRFPLGPRRAAEPVAGPAGSVRFEPADGHRYLVYEHDPGRDNAVCTRVPMEPGRWIWNRPASTVTHDGRVYHYRGVVSDELTIVCPAGSAVLVSRYAVGPSPLRVVVVAGAVLPILGFVYIAWLRRRARVTTDAGG